MPPFKSIVLFIHRWLGLITGLVVVIVSITGCLFVFQYEIGQWIRSDELYVDDVPSTQQTLPLPKLQKKAREALDVKNLTYGLVTYKNPQQTWSAMLYKGAANSWTYFGNIEAYKTAYINPYTGKVAGIIHEKKDFFQIMKGIHWSLLLATPIGQPIVTWSTVIFMVLLVTGFVLWWPKRWTKVTRQRSFNIKWGSTWRRINYDLHNVLGFYFLIITLIIALTGMYWYFPFAQKSLHFLGTGDYRLPAGPSAKVVSAMPGDHQIKAPLEAAYKNAWNEYPEAYSISFVSPRDSLDTIKATVRADGETYYEKSTLQFDQYSGKLIKADRYSQINAGEMLLSMNYDIHVGAIGGMPGKIIAFLASLICASLPVTGFIIWWDRKKRQWAREKKS